MPQLTIAQRLWLWASFATGVFLMACALAWYGLAASRDSLKEVHDQGMVALRETTEIRSILNANRTELLLTLQHDPRGAIAAAHDHPVEMHFKAVESRAAELDRLAEVMRKRFSAPQEAELVAAFDLALGDWNGKLRGLIAALKDGNFDVDVARRILALSKNEFSAVIRTLDDLAEAKVDVAMAAYTAGEIHRIAAAVTESAGDIRSLETLSGRISGIVNTHCVRRWASAPAPSRRGYSDWCSTGARRQPCRLPRPGAWPGPRSASAACSARWRPGGCGAARPPESSPTVGADWRH